MFSISIWAETRRRWWNLSRRPKEFHGKYLPLASLFPSFSLYRDRPVQTFSFLVYPDTLSPGVSACWLIMYAHLGNNPCVFPFANVHLSTSLWEPVRDMSVFGVTYAWKHISATYIFYNLFLSLSSKNLPLSFLM